MSVRGALLNRWDQVRNGYWFLPLVMAVGSVALSFGALELDTYLIGRLGDVGWLYSGSAEGARSVLTTIATSMIGLAGVVFSITTVTLTLAAKQFGPRIFRNFMRDTGTQVVLGTFTGTFLYCLLVLRQVHGSDGGVGGFVPQVSMLLAVVLAVCGLGVLIYFIHHVAASIQTPNVLAAVAGDLRAAIEELYPEPIGRDGPGDGDAALPAQVPERFDAEAVPVRAGAGGYVRRIEAGALLAAARDADVVVRVERRPGAFVAAGDALLLVWPADRAGREVIERLRSAVAVGGQRTPVQDVTFPIEQLVEVAALALSPGVNDLATATMCIDRLGEGLGQLAGRRVPSAYRADADGRLRVVAPPIDLTAALGPALDPIRLNGRGQPGIMAHLLGALAGVAGRAGAADAAVVLGHAVLAHAQAAEGATEYDRKKLGDALDRVRAAAAGRASEGGWE
ncbi:hypothetical protein GobsT_49950 [Gemmata obscuriglobus]|uniref:DUF2254 domain-containing protein n=1 Tax=Gemmata obscuriglobus TaxID=114 RepID=A0A2Z3H0I0_9BACT|nr:DUF2254 domain-containing protein [Gemmata obscuriglobus]AWM37086.1 DUF2254 domain-containing protein [Gemmata obscuriglobus]QEG30192.1 hypothetical protein GobsT_49950 [Gemmata obscuriglobus]VTS09516.1 Uncharacterized protein OS=Cyanothece sp. (strain PCC 7822) GN=Cyan7822_6085 PE=4 SV=1: DUF2254 [Gemmata obscuriglobus UQM 2246]